MKLLVDHNNGYLKLLAGKVKARSDQQYPLDFGKITFVASESHETLSWDRSLV